MQIESESVGAEGTHRLEEFDALVVCNGHYSHPRLPQVASRCRGLDTIQCNIFCRNETSFLAPFQSARQLETLVCSLMQLAVLRDMVKVCTGFESMMCGELPTCHTSEGVKFRVVSIMLLRMCVLNYSLGRILSVCLRLD